MSKRNDPAFPHIMSEGHPDYAPGMSLREHFAGQAMAAVIQHYLPSNGYGATAYQNCAIHAVRMADALLAELTKESP